METPEAANGPEWRHFPGRRVSVFAAEGSRAARLAPAELEAANRALVVLERLLGLPENATRHVTVYLVDPVSDLPVLPGAELDRPPDAVGRDGIVRVAPEDPASRPIAEPLTRWVVTNWFGEHAVGAEAVVTGLAGLVAAETGAGPSADTADDWARGEMGTGRPLQLGHRIGEASDELGRVLTATSYVRFLSRSYPSEALRRFLADYDPERRDAAAVSVFRKPLAALEDAWRESLARSSGRATLRDAVSFLAGLLQPYRWRYVEVVCWQLAAAILTLALPVAGGCVVDGLDRQPDEQGDDFCRWVAPTLSSARLAAIVGVVFALYLLQAAVTVRRGRVEGELFTRVGSDLKERVFIHLHRLPHNFHSRARLGDLVDCVSSDTAAVQASVVDVFGRGVAQGLVAVVVAATAMAKSPIVGALIGVVLILLIITQRRLGQRTAQANHQSMVAADEATVVAQESLAAHGTVKALSLEGRVTDSYRDRLRQWFEFNVAVSVLRQLYEGGVGLAGGLAQLAVLAAGGFLALDGSVDAGTVVTLMLLLPKVVEAVSTLALVAQSVELAWGPIVQVKDVLDVDAALDDRPGAAPLPAPVAGEIRFEGVTFAYGDAAGGLRGVDLRVPAGTHLAVVGASGAGKTTLVNLILRFWDPDEGRVLIDGHDLRDVTLASLRAAVAVVSQDTVLFNTTVRDNIGLGRPGATDAEIEAAARAARLHEAVVSLPAGYDTLVGERGLRLSGGERQRLAIARAILRDPAILLLDEPTSALDPRTEAAVVETLAAVAKGRTTVSVTQRPAMALVADRIIVLERGRLVEEGTHDVLVRAGGPYRRLFEQQGQDGRAGGATRHLAEVPLLAGVDEAALHRLQADLVREQHPAGSDIVRQGEPGDTLYLILSGTAEVLVDDGRGVRPVRVLRAGDYFGELALLTRQPRSATVRATDHVEVVVLGREAFMGLLEQEPQLRERLSQLVFARRTAYDAAALAVGLAAAERPAP